MRLVGYLGMFRKSQEVWARNFDPKGVNASRKHNPGSLKDDYFLACKEGFFPVYLSLTN